MTCALGTELRRVTSSCGELVACLASLVLGSGLRCPSTFMCSVQLQQVASDIWIPENLVSAAVNNWGVRWLWRLARRVFLFANITLNQQQFYRCNYPNFELLTALRNAPTSANILLFIGNRRSQGSSRWSRAPIAIINARSGISIWIGRYAGGTGDRGAPGSRPSTESSAARRPSHGLLVLDSSRPTIAAVDGARRIRDR